MKRINWNSEKNQSLLATRGVSFEDVVFCMENHKVLDSMIHPNTQKYPHQKILVVNLHDYAFLVPFVESETEIFLKTIIPSRKATKKYLQGEGDE